MTVAPFRRLSCASARFVVGQTFRCRRVVLGGSLRQVLCVCLCVRALSSEKECDEERVLSASTSSSCSLRRALTFILRAEQDSSASPLFCWTLEEVAPNGSLRREKAAKMSEKTRHARAVENPTERSGG